VYTSESVREIALKGPFGRPKSRWENKCILREQTARACAPPCVGSRQSPMTGFIKKKLRGPCHFG
jgi:hypothetical protein